MSARRFGNARRAEHGGGAIIAIVVVLVIVLVLTIMQMKGDGPVKGPDPIAAVGYIDRSADVTCASNRNAIKTDLTQMMILNDNKIPTIEQMRQRFGGQLCPRGGAYLIGPDGTVYCTKHFPPPAQLMAKMIELQPAVPDYTPPPLPQATPMQ